MVHSLQDIRQQFPALQEKACLRVRVSCHFFNSTADLDRLLNGVESARHKK